MNDKRIEEMLKENWSPNPPDGMKERILRRSREEIARKHSRVFLVANWKPVLAAVAALLVILTNVSDYRCQTRISAMMNDPSQQIAAPISADSLLEQRRRMEELLARLPADGNFEKEAISL